MQIPARHAPALLLVLAAAACGSNSGTGAAPSNGVPDGSDNSPTTTLAQAAVTRDPAASISASSLADAVAANNAFAVDMYSHLEGPNAGTNFLTSPISASIALTMAYAGAENATATEMATALHFPA